MPLGLIREGHTVWLMKLRHQGHILLPCLVWKPQACCEFPPIFFYLLNKVAHDFFSTRTMWVQVDVMHIIIIIIVIRGGGCISSPEGCLILNSFDVLIFSSYENIPRI